MEGDMDNLRKLHRRLADISNLDLEHSCKHKYIDASKTQKTARCIVLTASGFHGAAKQELQRLAASIGATYSGDLVLGTTTHLICKRLIDCFGTAKYQRALQWGIHIVTYDWLQASSAAGRPLREQDYKDDQPQALQPSPQPVKCQQQLNHVKQEQLGTSEQQAAQPPAAEVTIGAEASVCKDSPADTEGLGVVQQHECNTSADIQQSQQQEHREEHQQLSSSITSQAAQHTQQQLSLKDLPDDFLLQGSEAEDAAAESADEEAGLAAGGFSFSLSQYSLQQQQQEFKQRQQQPTASHDRDMFSRHVPAAAAAAASRDTCFGFRQLSTAAAEQSSPCMQNFVPLQHQQQQDPSAMTDLQSSASDGSEIQPEGIADIQPPPTAAGTAALPAVKQVQVQSSTPSSPSARPPECRISEQSPAATATDSGSPVSPVSPASSAESANEDDDACDDSPIGLLIPETQAELADPWGAAATCGGTPVSLKYYASQQRSRTRTAAAAAKAATGLTAAALSGSAAALGFSPAAAAAAAVGSGQQEDQQLAGEEGEEEGEELEDSDAAVTADETEEPSEAVSDESEGAASDDDDGLHDIEPATRPWSGSSSTAQSQQQQQQQPEFRLTQPSGSDNNSSRRSSGLTRLQRRDGYRRLGRVLVSELPDPSDLELQDSDCEDDCEHDHGHDCEVEAREGEEELYDEGLGDDMLEDSDCEDMQGAQKVALQQQQGQGVEASHMVAAPDSPVHSCTASSLPAHSSAAAAAAAAAAGIGSMGCRTASSKGTSNPEGTVDTPAASAVSGSSGAEMPVMRLKFSLSNTTDMTPGVQQQQDGSLYTPSCSYVSDEYSPCASTGRAGYNGGMAAEQHGTAEQQQQQQCEVTAGGVGVSPLSDPSTFITRRRGAGRGPGTPQQLHQQHEQYPSAAALLGQVFVKQEPVYATTQERPQHQHQQQQQVEGLAAAANPADAMLQAMKQQQQQRQQGQQPVLKPAPIKLEKLTPAEHMLQDLRQRQQQQAGLQHPTVASIAAEGIDDEADSQGAALHLPQQQQRLPRNSVASYATDISTVSRKVPLRVLGGNEKVIGGDSMITEGLPGSTTPLERLLQAALATRRDSGAAAAAEVAVKQEPIDWVHTPEGDGSRAAAAVAAAAVAAEGDSDDDAFEITELPTKVVAARNKAMTKQLDAHLAHLSQAGSDQVIPLKLLAKAPRGSTAKTYHGLRSSSKLTFADQVQIPWAHATLSTKEKSRCVIVADREAAAAAAAPAGSGAAAVSSKGQQQQDKVFVAEPVAFYKLESGEWWLELLRFYSTKELRLLAKAADCKLHLPADFHLSYELLRGMTHEHVPMRLVQGEFKLSKVKKVPSSSRSRANPFFWRYSIDTATCQVLTDRPVTDYVVQG